MEHSLRVVFFPSLYETSVSLDKAPELYPTNQPELTEVLQRTAASWPIKRTGKDDEATAKSMPWSFSLQDNTTLVAQKYIENVATFHPVAHSVPVASLAGLAPGPQATSFLLVADRLSPNLLVVWGYLAFGLSDEGEEMPRVNSPLDLIQVWMTDVTRENNRIVSRKTLRHGLASVSQAWRHLLVVKAGSLLDNSFLAGNTLSSPPERSASAAKRSKTEEVMEDLESLGQSPTRDQLSKILLASLTVYSVAASGVTTDLEFDSFDGLLERHFSELYQWTVASKVKGEQRVQVGCEQLINRIATFSFILYPYYYYDRSLLEVAAARWLPVSIKEIAAVFDNKYPLPRLFGQWITLAIHIFLEQVIVPVLSGCLSHLKHMFDLAALDCTESDGISEGLLTELTARRLVRYNIATNFAITHFGDNIHEVLKRLSKGGPAVLLLKSKLLNRSFEQPDERPLLVTHLVPMSVHLRSIALEKPVLNVPYGQQTPRVADTILDIEDLNPELAPNCIKRRLEQFADPMEPLEHDPRLTLNAELVTVIATLLRAGATGHESHVTSVPVQDRRRQIYAYVMNTYERLNRERAENIRLNRKVGSHDYGPVLKATLDGFVRNPSGTTYSRKCACAANAPDSYSCFYLTQHMDDKKVALEDCHRSLGLAHITAAVHPSELWAESVKRHKTRNYRQRSNPK